LDNRGFPVIVPPALNLTAAAQDFASGGIWPSTRNVRGFAASVQQPSTAAVEALADAQDPNGPIAFTVVKTDAAGTGVMMFLPKGQPGANFLVAAATRESRGRG
jgi:hypothetical protein